MHNQKVIALLLLLAGTVCLTSFTQPTIRTGFYHAMMGNDTLKINASLQALYASGIPEKKAFEGTLLMKKAGMVKGVGNKLDLFKKGKVMLEEEIQEQTLNAEYRFCRLMIQENAPRILGYRSDIANDTAILKKQFNKLDPDAKAALKDYSKKSKALQGAVLN